ncbi:MAG: DUF1801 domain-containing protein [Sphingomonas bacterium]|nr:DUF1801 domain-containing protein [Sphingomonas bacterium]
MVSSSAATVADYLAELDPERCKEIAAVRDVVNAALPAGYVEAMTYGMIGWVIPLSDYPDTYNGQPLAYAGLAAQTNSNSLYLNCAYASPDRTDDFREAWAASGKKLDMGKSCLRFKRADALALDVIRNEIAATTPAELIAVYEASRPPRR